MEKKKEYNFGEKEYEGDLKVWQSPKYHEAKKKAIEIIESEKYKGIIVPSDFWILMNKTKSGGMGYTGLIISHNACLKINDLLEDKFSPESVEVNQTGFESSLVFTYKNEEQKMYEVGEISNSNYKQTMGRYPYAMALKRCFDRVVLKLSKLAYAGIMSDSEADEFKEQPKQEEVEKAGKDILDSIVKLAKETETDPNELLSKYDVKKSADMTLDQAMDCYEWLKGKLNG